MVTADEGPSAELIDMTRRFWIGLVLSLPLIALATGSRYYLARDPESTPGHESRQCVICENHFEPADVTHCPAYVGTICSLCCSLDARCGDLCKPQASLASQWRAALHWLLPRAVWPYLETGVGHFLLLALVIAPVLAAVFVTAALAVVAGAYVATNSGAATASLASQRSCINAARRAESKSAIV